MKPTVEDLLDDFCNDLDKLRQEEINRPLTKYNALEDLLPTEWDKLLSLVSVDKDLHFKLFHIRLIQHKKKEGF